MENEVEVDAERVIARLRPRGRYLIWPALLLIVLVGATVYFLGNLPEPWQNWAVLILAASATAVLVVLPYLSWLAHRYIITTRRIVIRHGLFVRVRQELLHSRNYDVTVRQSTLQTLSGCGDIRINAGLDAPVVLADVPSATLVLRVIQDLMHGASNTVSVNRQISESAPDETTVLGTR